MCDLAEYFSDKDRIKELEDKLNTARRIASRYKQMYEESKGKKLLTRSDKARLLIKELKNTDRPVNLIRSIAKKCFLTEGTVNRIWYCS